MSEISLLVLHPNAEYGRTLVQAFAQYNSEMEIVHLTDMRDAPSVVAQDRPSTVVVGVDSAEDPALRTVQAIRTAAPTIGIVVISQAPTHELLVSCMRAGTDEFLEFPIEADKLAEAMDGLFRRKGIAGATTGKVTAVFSASGGTGVTTIASHLAAGIAAEIGTSDAACILDMNLQFGTVALAMDIREITHTLTEAAADLERLDENLLRSFMSEHTSGAFVLPAPLAVGEADNVDPWGLRGVIQMCRKAFQHVILDMPHQIVDASIVGLDEADDILLVCDMVLPSVRLAIRALETFDELEYKRDRFHLVINRHYDSHQISLDEVVQHVKLPIYWLIPYDSQAAISSLNGGQTMDVACPDSEAAHSLVALAQHTAGIVPKAKSSRKRRGFFNWGR
jgi:pilus assembly protein CpaE